MPTAADRISLSWRRTKATERLLKYRPDATVFLNITKDHKTTDEIKKLFVTLASQSSWTASNADDPILASIPATVRFGSK